MSHGKSVFLTTILSRRDRQGRRVGRSSHVYPRPGSRQGWQRRSQRTHRLGRHRHRGRGGYVLGCFLNEPVVQFVAIADIRKDRRENVKNIAEAKYGPGVSMYRDFAKCFRATTSMPC